MRAALVALLGWLASGRAGAAEEGSSVVNVTPAFRPGPYALLRVDPAHPESVAVACQDGFVLWSDDGGLSARETRVLSPRQYAISALRGNNDRHREYASPSPDRGGIRLFLSLINQELPVTRVQLWMQVRDPSVELSDLALAPRRGRLAAAGPAGVFLSDPHRGGWQQVIGGPRPLGKDLAGLAVAVDPEEPSHILAATSAGVFSSRDGGRSFRPHEDRTLRGKKIRRLMWDVDDHRHLLAIADTEVYGSTDRGASFDAVFDAEEETVNAVALARGSAHIATSDGVISVDDEGHQQKRLEDENVVGVVALGEGRLLAATAKALYYLDGDDTTAVMRPGESDPLVGLEGTADLAWALTRFGLYRVGPPVARSRAPAAPHVTASLQLVERAVVRRLGLPTPSETRMGDRWYAKLLPTITLRVKGTFGNDYSLSHDGTLPIPFHIATADRSSYCCGTVPGDDPGAVVVLVHWDLSKLLLGDNGNVSNPNSFIEAPLRSMRGQILAQVRWRYRECANLAALLKRPPSDRQTALSWRMRLEEHASYLEALTGFVVVEMPEMEEP